MNTFPAVLALIPLVACASTETPADDQAVLALGIKDARLVEPHLLSSGQYDEAQFRKLPELGYHTVIQLRVPTEDGAGWEEAKAQQVGVRFVRIPVDGTKGLTEANARKLASALEDRRGGTVVACNSGNRVGGLFALKAYYCDKLPAEQALEVGRKAGLAKAEPEVRKILGLPAK
jgi:protein tyrosine phosphatase (PTP) superfamily phosphohydrolase (DUF442 family)